MARHWREYDDRLVKLGEEMFSGASGFLQLNIEKVKQELEGLNRGKVHMAISIRGLSFRLAWL